MREFISSVTESIKNRLNNSLYGTFFISWLIFHWNFVFSLFFLNEENIWEHTHLLKNDYLVERFINFLDWYFYTSWIAPFILTWIVIWKLPDWILIKAYTMTEKYEAEKAIIKISQDKRIEQARTMLEKENVKTVKEVVKKVKEEEKIRKIDPTVSWSEEFENIARDPKMFEATARAVEVVYKFGGEFVTNANQADIYRGFLSSDQLSRLDTAGIVEIGKGRLRDKIAFTEKGKFFVKEFQGRRII